MDEIRGWKDLSSNKHGNLRSDVGKCVNLEDGIDSRWMTVRGGKLCLVINMGNL